MNDRSSKLTKTVNVTMHSLALSEKDISYAKVQRNTAYIGNIIDNTLEHNQTLDRETLLFSAGLLRNGILELLKAGKAVDLLEMGTLYIKPVGGMDTANPCISDVPAMGLAFTPSELALEAVKGVKVAADITESNDPAISELYNISTRTSGTALAKGQTVRLKGKRLKIAGEEAETGIFFAACDENGNSAGDLSAWTHIPVSEIIDNTTSILLFNVPETMASGNYRLIVRTAYGSGTRINKTVRNSTFPEIVSVG